MTNEEKIERKRESKRKWREAHPDYNKQYRERHKEELNEKSKKYRLEHSEELKEYRKRYRLEHPEKVKEANKKWATNNADKIKQYRLDHSDEIKSWQRQYYSENSDKFKEYHKQIRKTLDGRARALLHAYNQKDILRGFDISNNITPDWIIENIFSGQQCVYCGESDWQKLGVDRVDNSKPHIPDNLVCCCGECNVKRNKHYTFEEFKDKIAGH